MADDQNAGKKCPCPDCNFCQWCSDDRCRICRGDGKRGKKLSMAEQIALYDRINGQKDEKDEKDKKDR